AILREQARHTVGGVLGAAPPHTIITRASHPATPAGPRHNGAMAIRGAGSAPRRALSGNRRRNHNATGTNADQASQMVNCEANMRQMRFGEADGGTGLLT